MTHFREDMEKKYPALVDRIATSRVAAIKLMCLECVGGCREEVRHCTSTTCPLYAWRPYKPSCTNDIDNEHAG